MKMSTVNLRTLKVCRTELNASSSRRTALADIRFFVISSVRSDRTGLQNERNIMHSGYEDGEFCSLDRLNSIII
jgi:hypothetical protein